MTWNYHKTLADGHRLFTRDEDCFFYVADDSGDTPDDTDDGPLRLDMSRPLSLAVYPSGEEFAGIPLVTTRGEKSRTPSNATTLLVLAATTGWSIEADDRNYTIKENE